MFGFFASQEKKMRENAGNWLELGEKVYHYRRDVLTPVQVGHSRLKLSDLRRRENVAPVVIHLFPQLEPVARVLAHFLVRIGQADPAQDFFSRRRYEVGFRLHVALNYFAAP